MNEYNWSYTYNTFEVSTRSSTKKMSILGPDHLSKLENDSGHPEVVAMSLETQTPLDDFIVKYSNWMSIVGAYKGETNRFTNILAELSSLKIKQWDIQIQGEFLEGTSDYIALMPNGRSAFQKGAYDVRLTKVSALANRLLTYPALSTLQTAVAAYYTTLLSARDAQQQMEGQVKIASDELDAARIALANQMYKNLGALMSLFNTTPLLIERYFDLSLIRSHSSDTGGGDEAITVNASINNDETSVEVFSIAYLPTRQIKITNNGPEDVEIFIANTVADGGTPVVVAHETTMTFMASMLGPFGDRLYARTMGTSPGETTIVMEIGNEEE